jgi:hypothetical protein
MPNDDELIEVYRRQKLLLKQGTVFWGALVQANNRLFKDGPDDHPALTTYSESGAFENSPDKLVDIARRLFRLKSTTPTDPEERRLADMITDEMERGMGWLVPRSCTGGVEVRSTTFMVFRGHIPGRRLASGWFPLLTHPETPAVMIVPCRYWPQELVAKWSEDGRR